MAVNPELLSSLIRETEKRKKEEDVSTLGEIGRGIGAGVVSIPQGIAELGAGVYDLLADEDTTQSVTAFFEQYKPETTTGVGNFFKYATQFGIPGLGAAGILSKAGKLNTVNLIGASAATDFAFATNDIEPLTDMLLSGTSDDQRLQGIRGSELAAENLLDRIKIGAEAALVVTGTPIAIKYGAKAVGGTAAQLSKIPGVQESANFLSDISTTAVNGLKTNKGTSGKLFNYLSSKLTPKGALPNQAVFLAQAAKNGNVAARVLGVEQNFQNVNTLLTKIKRAGVINGDDEIAIAKSIQDYLRPLDRAIYEQAENVNKSKLELATEIQNTAKKDLVNSEKQIINLLNKAGKKDLANELASNGLVKNAEETRNTITGLSNEIYDLTDPERMVAKGIENPQGRDAILVSEEMRNTVKQYESLYGARSFRALEENAFLVDQSLKDKAIEEISRMGGGLDPKTASDIFDEIASGNYFGTYTFDKPIALEKFESGILKGRKLDSMPAVREALGEITGYTQKGAKDILANTALASSITTNRMASLVGKAKSFEKMVLADQQAVELGLTPFLKRFDDVDTPTVVRDGVRYDKITDKNMGALQGYYVQPEVKSALEGQVKIISESLPGFLSPMYKAFLGAKGASALAKTVFSPITQVRNAAGGFFFTAMNGNLGRSGDFARSFATVMGPIGSKLTKAEQREVLQEALELNVINSSAAFREIESLLDDSSKVYAQMTQNIPGAKAVGRKLDDTVKNGLMSKLYVAGDDIWKLYNYNVELDKLAKAFTKYKDAHIPVYVTDNLLFLRNINALDNIGSDKIFKAGVSENKLDQALKAFQRSENYERDLLDFLGKASSADTKLGASNLAKVREGAKGFTIDDAKNAILKKEAANVVADNIPNYSRVSPFIRGLRQLPIGNFVSFPAEIIRTSGNVLGRSIAELTSDNPLIREYGMQRLMGGMVTGGALAPAAQAAGMALTGVDKEKIDAYQRSFAAPWDRASTLIPIASDKNGNPTEFYNFTYTNPYDFLTRPFRGVAIRWNEGRAKDEELLSSAMLSLNEGFTQLFEPFFAPSIITQATIDAMRGETETGRKIYNDGDTLGFKFGSTFAHLLESINPGINPVTFSADPGSGMPLYIKPRFKDFPKSVLVSTGALGEEAGYTRSGQPLDMAEELVQAFTGFKNVKPQVDIGLRYRGYEATDQVRSSGNLFNRVARSRDPRSAKDFTNAFLLSNEARFKALRDLGLAVEDARKLGLDDGKIALELQRAKVPNRGLIMSNMFSPSFPSSDVITASILSEKNKVSQSIPFGEISRIYAEQFGQPLISEKQTITQPAQVQSGASDILRQQEINKLLTGQP